jgi:hypothetical protein
MMDEKYNVIKMIMDIYYSNLEDKEITNIFGDYVESKFMYENCIQILDRVRDNYKLCVKEFDKTGIYTVSYENPNFHLSIWYANIRELFPKIQKKNGLDTFYKSYDCKFEIRDEELNRYI